MFTYALKKFVDDETETQSPDFRTRAWVYFDQGNELLRQLAQSGEADVWWEGRSLLVTTGCIGPRPPGECKFGPFGTIERMDYGDESMGFTPPEERQGYHIVTVDSNLGVVSKIDWIRMWYRDNV